MKGRRVIEEEDVGVGMGVGSIGLAGEQKFREFLGSYGSTFYQR